MFNWLKQSKSSIEIAGGIIVIIGAIYGGTQYFNQLLSEQVRQRSIIMDLSVSNANGNYDETISIWKSISSNINKEYFNTPAKLMLYDILLYAVANSQYAYENKNILSDFPSRYDVSIPETPIRIQTSGWIDLLSDDCEAAKIKFSKAIRLSKIKNIETIARDAQRGNFYCALMNGNQTDFENYEEQLKSKYYYNLDGLADEVFQTKGTSFYVQLDKLSDGAFSKNTDSFINGVKNNQTVTLTERNRKSTTSK
ncbi:hypothetical protein [Aquitalea pelogenes]|uniref:hypothetical protein n=1 Tax=Aquitalea pelogenes TaxID=1293573 RepID=UPI00128EAA00|nr:hypothetical protein [Aquitalea pelogenes]